MAITKTAQSDVLSGGTILYDSDADGTVESDVMAGATNVDMIIVDNQSNAAEVEYLKLWDSASPIVGTTVPDFVFEIPAGQAVILDFDEVDSSGTETNFVAFTTALSYAAVTAAGTGGTTGPTSSMKVWIHIAD